jgi:release factor glutamine methyltransferase
MSTEAPWTIRRLLDWTTRFLGGRGVESAAKEAAILLAHALNWRRLDLYTRHDEEPDEEGRHRFRELVRRRADGCPVAYLVGFREFFSLDFEVGPAVLVPRPETEWLVDEGLRLARDILPEPRVLDLGTGSGCVAVAVAKHCPAAQVVAVDVSAEALAIAERNAGRHQVAERIAFLHGDLFAPLPPGELFDLILSNPPYIPTGDVAGLEPTVRDFEPRLALDGGPDGLAVFDCIVREAPAWLKLGGSLLVEIGADQEAAARARIEGNGRYLLAPTVYDGEGRPRVLRAQRAAG